MLIARIDTVYLVGIFCGAEYDDTNQQARNASRRPDTGKARQQAFERAALAALPAAVRSGYCGG
jgi:hypothetical protein